MIADKDVVQALSTIAEYCKKKASEEDCKDCVLDKIVPNGDCQDLFSCSPYCHKATINDFLNYMEEEQKSPWPELPPDNVIDTERYTINKDGYGTLKNDNSKETHDDAVNHPAHYCQGGIETIDVIKAKMPPERFRGFLQGNVIKYVTRAEFKGKQLEDLEKAAWYLGRLIQELEGDK